MARRRDELPEVTSTELREVNSLLQLDESTQKPGFHYRWVKESPLAVGKAKMRGYVLVTKDEGVQTLAGYTDDRGDSAMRIGDVVLMACPLAGYRKRKRGQMQVAASRLSAPAKQFRKNARRRGAKILREEDE